MTSIVIATRERPRLTVFAQAPEGGGVEGGGASAGAAGALTLVTAGRGGSTTFATSRGGSGASAGGSNVGRTVLCSSPAWAGKMVGTLWGSLHGLPA